eukprot:4719888-Pleurochrysis_carterae.AAC.1
MFGVALVHLEPAALAAVALLRSIVTRALLDEPTVVVLTRQRRRRHCQRRRHWQRRRQQRRHLLGVVVHARGRRKLARV